MDVVTERSTERRWLRINEVAERLGLSRSKVYELVAAGELVAVKPSGGALRVPAARLEDYMDRFEQDVSGRQ